MNSSFNKLLTFKTVITASMIIVFSINLLLVERVDALSDSRQLVLDAWTLVNEGFYDPEKFDEIQWKRIRQKTLQKQIETSEEAYSAIEDMLRPLDDPFTRVLRPKDYELLRSSNFGSEINGVGLQLGEDDNNKVKVISTLGGSPAEEAGIVSGDIIETVDGISSEKLGLASTCLLYTSPSPRDLSTSRMPSSA